jgi:hypothetical protein
LAARTRQYQDETSKREGVYQKQQALIRMQRKEQSEVAFQNMLERMDSQQGLVEDCAAYLKLKDETVERKKDRLHRKWSTDVFLPIQERVTTQLKMVPTSTIEAKRVAALNEYIHTVNTKAGVYRDIIDNEYDPLKLNKTCLRIRSGDLEDPLKKDLANLAKEKALMSAIMDTGDQTFTKDHRDMLDLLLWDKLDSTPYARYNAPPKPAKLPPGMTEDPRRTNIKIDHYHIVKGPDLIKKEYFPAGKFIPSLAHRPSPFGLDFPSGRFDQQRLHNPGSVSPR